MRGERSLLDRAVTGDALVTGLEPRALAANAPLFAPLKDIGLSVNLASRFALSGARVTKADFDATASFEMPLAGLKGGTLHVRRVTHLGAVSEWSFNPLWVRLDVTESDEFGVERLALVSRGRSLGIATFLVGESLMRQADVTAATRALLAREGAA